MIQYIRIALLALFSLSLTALAAVFEKLKQNGFRIQYFDLTKLFPGLWQPKQIGDYYNEWTGEYLEAYGTAIQAFRPDSEEELYAYIMKNADIQDGMHVLDAGCGVGGPSLFLAQHKDVKIDAINISAEQVRLAQQSAIAKDLDHKINVQQADYHNLDEIFPANTFDRILFLESFGHSPNPQELLGKAFKVLKPGGIIYLKDFFKKELPYEADKRAVHNLAIKNMDKVYFYNTPNLYHTLFLFRIWGFEIMSIQTPTFIDDDYEVVVKFQNKNNIDLYGGHTQFRIVEPFEFKCRKPLEGNAR